MVGKGTERAVKLGFKALPVLGVFCLLVSTAIAVNAQRFTGPSTLLFLFGLLLFLTMFIKAEINNLLYYLHVGFYSAVVFAVCALVYLFAVEHAPQFDLTEQKLFSLSDATKQYLDGLDHDVTVTIFTTQPKVFDDMRAQYGRHTDRLTWNFVDATRDPVTARKFGERVSNGTMFLTSGERQKSMNVAELSGTDYENIFTNAIVEVTREQRVKIYFTLGHGELPYHRPQPAEDERTPTESSVQALRLYLNDRGMETAALDLATSSTAPADATMIVIAGPQRDLYGPEADVLRDYLAEGGKLLLLADPQVNDRAELTRLNEVIGAYGVQLPRELILDRFSKERAGLSVVQPILAQYDPQHPISRELGTRRERIPINLVRPVRLADVPPDSQATTLILSSPQSWTIPIAEMMAGGEALAAPAEDKMAPQPMGVAVSQIEPPPIPGRPELSARGRGTRLVVYGSSDLIKDEFLMQQAVGAKLMLNTIEWLTEREDMVAVPPRQLAGTPMVLDEGQLRVIFLIVVLLLPAALFFGGVSYAQLRRRG